MTENILIVDDDKTIRNLMRDFLKTAGFRAAAVKKAREALHYLNKTSADVVVTDIMMEDISGLELTRIIKKNFHADVIVITGYTSQFSYEDAVSKGASDFIFKPFKMEELLLRIKRVLRERQLSRERNEMIDQLKKLAITDSLTQLYNSRYFYSQLQKEIERFNRYKRPLSLLLMDIDHFKHYNDKFGHLAGDNVLVRLGGVIKTCLRTMDTGYRYGGEEFTVLLPETSAAEAFVVAERIQAAMQMEKFQCGGKASVTITLSIGVTEYSPGEETKEFVKRADEAMYLSKKKGRNAISMITEK